MTPSLSLYIPVISSNICRLLLSQIIPYYPIIPPYYHILSHIIPLYPHHIAMALIPHIPTARDRWRGACGGARLPHGPGTRQRAAAPRPWLRHHGHAHLRARRGGLEPGVGMGGWWGMVGDGGGWWDWGKMVGTLSKNEGLIWKMLEDLAFLTGFLMSGVIQRFQTAGQIQHWCMIGWRAE